MNNTPEVIQIPKKVKDDIMERGFHLYKWISPDEVKLSIERDFLAVLKKIGLPLAIISGLAALISGLSLLVFFITITTGVIAMFCYLLYLSVRRSLLLSRSAFVVITDSSISLGGKVHKLSDVSAYKHDISEVSKNFDEELFGESGLSNSKHSLMKDVIRQLFGGYEAIFKMTSKRFGRSKDSEKGILMLIAFYTMYVVFMACVYFIGVLGLWILGKFIVWANTKYLIKKGEKVILINSLFGELSVKSEDLKQEQISLKSLLDDAQKSEWKDGLLLAIKEEITKINTSAQDAIISVLKLRNTIQGSKHKQMFRFEVYNGWIKKQILSPLKSIRKLLVQNKIMLINSKKEIENTIQNTEKNEFVAALKLTLTRIEMQIGEFERYIPQIEASIKKLEG